MNVTDDTPKAPRILVVEDDADQLELICDALESYYGPTAGDRIRGVRSASQCLAEDPARFDVVLQDWNLPDMPGLKLLEEIRTRADVPVVVVTGENDSATAGDAIAHGAQDYVVKLGDYLFTIPVLIEKSIDQHRIRRQNARLQKRLREMLRELEKKNAELKKSMDQLESMATTDSLTGLSNRRRFDELLRKRFDEARRYGFDLTCCMCDLDCYKNLNDTLGHQVGDRVLADAAAVISKSLRKADVAGRYGGDEFVLLLPHTPLDRAVQVTERIRRELKDVTCRLSGCEGVTLSVGVASLNADDPVTAEELLAMADRALYLAKQQGKDRVVAFSRVRDVA
ncbi:MAG: diguanylate cyclase [Planctomycetota bacterium]